MFEKALKLVFVNLEKFGERLKTFNNDCFLTEEEVKEDIVENNILSITFENILNGKKYRHLLIGDLFYSKEDNSLYIVCFKKNPNDHIFSIGIDKIPLENMITLNYQINEYITHETFSSLKDKGYSMDNLIPIGNILLPEDNKEVSTKKLLKKFINIHLSEKKYNIDNLFNSFKALENIQIVKNNVEISFLPEEENNYGNDLDYNYDEDKGFDDIYYTLEFLNDLYDVELIKKMVFHSDYTFYLTMFLKCKPDIGHQFIMGASNSIWFQLPDKYKKFKKRKFDEFMLIFDKDTLETSILFEDNTKINDEFDLCPYPLLTYDVLIKEYQEYEEKVLKYL